MRRIIAAVSVNPMLSTIFSLHILLLCFSPWFCSARDNITWGNQLRDHDGETLVSSGGIYELGFFTPNGGSDSKRYIGIWHCRSSPQTAVWVANRDKPISDTSGVFAIAEDGNLVLLEAHNQSYWKTSLNVSSPFDRMVVKLMDSGNLVLSDEDQKYLWQSFDNPTDTFLSGMNMSNSMVLTSWRSNNDPAPGDYMFQQDEEGYRILKNKFNTYWQSSVSGSFISSDEVALLSAILSSQYNEARLVMNSTGKIQFYLWESKTSLWNLKWFEPRNRCSVYNACGNFGSCNSNTRSLCKCLPGFEPNSPKNWRSGDFSEGCTRKSNKCSKDVRNEKFLNLKMMKVSKPGDQVEVKNEMECQNACLLHKCNCQAYSFNPLPRQVEYNKVKNNGPVISTARPNCWIWSSDLKNLWENFTGGRDLHVRVSPSDIGLKNRTCEACGTNIIPYPLGTTQNCSDLTYPNCGDPMYFSFNCCIDTSQLSFKTSNGYYTVTNINPESHTFTIQIQDTHNCKESDSVGKLLQLNKYLPFYVRKGCNEEDIDSNLEPSFKDRGLKEVDIGWKQPLEPLCITSQDCIDWPHTTCNTTRDDKQSRCRCNAFFQWDGFSLNCTPETGDSKPHGGPPHKQKLLDLFLGIISAVIVISGVICVLYYFRSKRRIAAIRRESRGSVQGNQAFRLYDSERLVKDFINSGQFREDDKKGIDVPFFYLESILAATDNLSDANKLGQGGFGPVYKGTFPGGQEIAIKRLSNGSGQGLEEFKNEVVLIAKLQHRNLVRLLGYCVDWDEKMLLYEYMPNKSLDSFIFDRTLCVLLNWEIRFNIIMGIARGLLYLHQDSRLRIIHRDLKTSNVLLDEEMNPKISDFGLARIVGGKQTEATTNRVVGTYGYMSPEYALDGFFSIKSDVFSFGVVILEIISGKRNTGFYQSEKVLSLLGYTWRLWKEDKAMDLMDRTLRESCYATEFLRCVNVGLLCVQEDPSDRPTMSTVLFMLGNETATVPNPKQPPFVVRRPLSNTASSSNKLEVNAELTASLEQGR